MAEVVSSVQGGEFGHGFISSGLGGAVGATFRYGWQGMIASAVVGGTASETTGGKFANGAATTSFTYAAQWGLQKYGAGGINDLNTEGKKGTERYPPEQQESIKYFPSTL